MTETERLEQDNQTLRAALKAALGVISADAEWLVRLGEPNERVYSKKYIEAVDGWNRLLPPGGR